MSLRRRLPLWLVPVVLAGVYGCTEKDPVELGGTLAVSPAALQLTPEAGGQFSLSSAPAGARLEWQVTAKPDWAVVEPMSGVIDGAVVNVSVSAAGLLDAGPGTYTGSVEVISTGGAGSVAVTAVVASDPRVAVSPASLAYGPDDEVLTLTVENEGTGVLSWGVGSPGGRIYFSQSSGDLVEGAAVDILATYDRTGLTVGTWQDSIIVTSNGAVGSIRVPVTVEVPAEPRASVSSERVMIFPDSDTASTFLSNPGTGPLTWSAAGSIDGISVAPSSGVLPVGDTVLLAITADREVLTGYGGVGEVVITSDAVNDAPRIQVELSHWSRPWILDHRVVDAEHSRAMRRIITVSADPHRLNIIDPVEQTVQHVTLPLMPSAVSVRRDGLFAAVGHNGYVSYVDLVAGSVQQVYAVTTDAVDVVLADSGWVYVFPRTDQWETIRSMELSTGAETQSGGYSIYAGTVARLHPSGDFM